MKRTYILDDNIKNIVLLQLKQTKNAVVKERLTFVSMFLNGIYKQDIATITGRTNDTVGKWITAYFEGGIDALEDHRGGDHKSFLTNEDKEELKNIIRSDADNKTWDGNMILDLIKSKFDVTYTRAGVYALMKSLNIRYKRVGKINS